MCYRRAFASLCLTDISFFMAHLAPERRCLPEHWPDSQERIWESMDIHNMNGCFPKVRYYCSVFESWGFLSFQAWTMPSCPVEMWDLWAKMPCPGLTLGEWMRCDDVMRWECAKSTHGRHGRHTSAVRFILQPAFQFEGTQVQSLCCDYGSCFLVCLPSHFFSLFCVRNERAWVVCLESSILSASSYAGEHFWPHWGSVSCCDCRQADKTVSCLNLQLIRLGLKD